MRDKQLNKPTKATRLSGTTAEVDLACRALQV